MAKTLIIGSKGQLGRALHKLFPEADSVDIDTLDITNKAKLEDYGLEAYELIINAAAYTNVDGAEHSDNALLNWEANAVAPVRMASLASPKATFVHISTDYVFDGSVQNHTEDEAPTPINNYGRAKAAADIGIPSVCAQYFIVRTSWVIGDGNNFVATMKELAKKGIEPSVVSDQHGRPTFTSELARAIKHIVDSDAAYGIYNVSGSGDVVSWAELARATYAELGADPASVSDTTTENYYAGKSDIAPRPTYSDFDLTKIQSTDLELTDWRESLKQYLQE